MDRPTLNHLRDFLERRADGIQNTKGKDYTDNDDVIYNTKGIARIEERLPSQVCLTLLLKHINSIAKDVRTGNTDLHWITPDDKEGLLQKIVDARTWLLLLTAALVDEGDPFIEFMPKVYDGSKPVTINPGETVTVLWDISQPGGLPLRDR